MSLRQCRIRKLAAEWQRPELVLQFCVKVARSTQGGDLTLQEAQICAAKLQKCVIVRDLWPF